MKEADQVCIKVCPIQKDMRAAPENSRKNMKDKNGFLYVQNLNKEWRLVLPGTFNSEGKNSLEIAIAEAHAATAHGGIKKMMKALTDKFQSLAFSCLVRVYVGTCNICPRTKYTQREPIGYGTPLHVPVRPWRDITMGFLRLSPVFTCVVPKHSCR